MLAPIIVTHSSSPFRFLQCSQNLYQSPSLLFLACKAVMLSIELLCDWAFVCRLSQRL